MYSTAIQTKTHSTKDIRQQTSSTGNEKDTNAEMVDPFMQIIMSLLTQSNDQSTQTVENTRVPSNANQLGELTALLQNSSADVTALINTLINGGTDANSEMTAKSAEALASLLNLQALKDTSAQAAANITFGTQASTVSAVNTGQASQSTNLSDMLGLSGQSTNIAGTAETITISSDTLSQIAKLLGLSDKNELQSMLKSSGFEVVPSESISTQDGLSGAIVKAKQMLSDYLPQQTEQEEVDVDNLQNELVKIDRMTPFELSLKSAGETTETNVANQIAEGIKQSISVGKSEFAIKLTPETLGEITVKLVEDAGKTTLTISTANEQAAKLINKDIDALRQALAPMNVEVRNAVVSTNESAGGSMQQYDMAGQQFAGQQFAGHQSFLQMTQTASGQNETQASDDVYAFSQAAQMTALSSKRLDAYI